MACHLTYINNNGGVVVFDMFAYMNNMRANMNDFDEATKTRLGNLGELFGKGVNDENIADYLSAIAETIQYVEAVQQAKGMHLAHTHGIEDVVQDIINSEHGVTLGLREPQAQTYKHRHHHEMNE